MIKTLITQKIFQLRTDYKKTIHLIKYIKSIQKDCFKKPQQQMENKQNIT